ncbi:C40 family peptidase [Candidatus Uhrbacteria bacterium]|nr:C40 family peptidase [Candidatus Uhrbacteria bacterium]
MDEKGLRGTIEPCAGDSEYRAVGDRCAVALAHLDVRSGGKRLARAEVLAMLERIGCTVLDVDVVVLARSLVGRATWRRGTRFHEAPGAVDCSTFVKWLYGQRGIWIPRRSIQQLWYRGNSGCRIERIEDLRAGDLVFASGFQPYYKDSAAAGVGHVGVVTDTGTVIHAANRTIGVTESPLAAFTARDRFHGARRLAPTEWDVITLQAPSHRDVEYADDLRWMLYQQLPWTAP